jgi:alkanesulfonate monooxygenase SsuD/methylene tetrahydromethanopterin reductase-like flavin-dependent oxidoreductase (luciferase family)
MANLRYGLYLSPAGPAGDPRAMAELAAEAEAAGWDGIFLEDYIVWQGRAGTPTYDPWVVMAAMAVATRRVRLGTAVTPLPRRRPWKLAAEAVTLDHLSGGRVVLGVGSGDPNCPSFSATGEDTSLARRVEQLDEGLELLTALWLGEPVTFHGRHYRVDGLRLTPRPLQHPRIPIWVGGDWNLRGVRARVARYDGSCAYKGSPAEPWQDMTPDDVRAVAGAGAGRPGLDVVVGGRRRGEDWDRDREHIAAVAAAGATWWSEWIEPVDREATYEAVRRGPLRID